MVNDNEDFIVQVTIVNFQIIHGIGSGIVRDRVKNEDTYLVQDNVDVKIDIVNINLDFRIYLIVNNRNVINSLKRNDYLNKVVIEVKVIVYNLFMFKINFIVKGFSRNLKRRKRNKGYIDYRCSESRRKQHINLS